MELDFELDLELDFELDFELDLELELVPISGTLSLDGSTIISSLTEHFISLPLYAKSYIITSIDDNLSLIVNEFV